MKQMAKFRLINVYTDSPFSVWNGNSNVDVLRSLHLYDKFAIWSHKLVPAIESAGCKNVIYFPFAYDDEIFCVGSEITEYQRTKFKTDVLFAGTWDVDREKFFDRATAKNARS